MKIKSITDHLESIVPLHLQEVYDNAGLIIGDEEANIKSVLICIDSTEEVIDEAIRKKCNLVIAHHPIVFCGLKKINGENYVERTIIKAIKNNIAIYAIHTNLDNIQIGVNKMICNKLGLKNTKILSLKHISEKMKVGAGMIGELNKPMSEKDFLFFVKKQMQTLCIRHTKLFGKKIKRVAVCGGSGSFLLSDAIRQNANIFITADFKYHQFFDAEKKIIIADIGHYESEQFVKELLFELLKKKFPTFVFHLSKINTNPINYL
ncbi:MAG: Nif3-like dinuclear metal center hexameric protein [Bacteroidota bacterium]